MISKYSQVNSTEAHTYRATCGCCSAVFCFPSEICSACATSRFRKAAEWTIYVLQQTVVFAVSASGASKPVHSVRVQRFDCAHPSRGLWLSNAGVIFAGEESYKSTIYSNQLMAYVMVSLPVGSKAHGLCVVLCCVVWKQVDAIKKDSGILGHVTCTACFGSFLGLFL